MTALIRSLLIAVAFVLAMPSQGSAQATLQIIEKRSMKFGEWAASDVAAGAVTMPPTSDSASGSGPLINFGGTVRRARFQLVGEPKAYVFVTLPSSITIRKGSSGNVMTVDNFTMDQDNPVRLNKSGKKTINIGATLHIGAGQKKGNYNDDNIFFIDADYQ